MESRIVIVVGLVLSFVVIGMLLHLVDKGKEEEELLVEEFEWVGSKGALECIFVMKGKIGAVYCPEMSMRNCRSGAE